MKKIIIILSLLIVSVSANEYKNSVYIDPLPIFAGALFNTQKYLGVRATYERSLPKSFSFVLKPYYEYGDYQNDWKTKFNIPIGAKKYFSKISSGFYAGMDLMYLFEYEKGKYDLVQMGVKIDETKNNSTDKGVAFDIVVGYAYRVKKRVNFYIDAGYYVGVNHAESNFSLKSESYNNIQTTENAVINSIVLNSGIGIAF